jgi:hypothetical protein
LQKVNFDQINADVASHLSASTVTPAFFSSTNKNKKINKAMGGDGHVRIFILRLFCYAIFQSCSSFLHAYFASIWAVGFYGCMLSAMVFSAFLFSVFVAIYILLSFKKVLHN